MCHRKRRGLRLLGRLKKWREPSCMMWFNKGGGIFRLPLGGLEIVIRQPESGVFAVSGCLNGLELLVIHFRRSLVNGF